MKSSVACVFLLSLLTVTSVAHAGGAFDPIARARSIAPLIEEDTFAVLHADLSRLQVKPLLAAYRPLLVAWQRKPERAEEATAQLLDSMTKAGVRDVYALIAPGGQMLQQWLFVAIPLPSGTDQSALRAALNVAPDAGYKVDHFLVFDVPVAFHVADSRLKRPPKQFHPAARPELTAAFEAAGDTAVQAILIPPAYSRRVIEELMPELPKWLGGRPSTVFSRGVSWAALGLDVAPRQSLRLVIQSPDAKAAESLNATLVDALRTVGQIKSIRSATSHLDNIATAFAPQVRGDRLTLSLERERLEGLLKALSVLANSVRTTADRSASRDNLKRIALAMHNYYARNEQFPLPASHAPDGKPLLSWRVYLLPYLDQNALFQQFHLNEPWDSPHNRALVEKMPDVYRLPTSETPPGRTNYVLPLGNGAGFTTSEPTTFKQIEDGSSNTIMVFEADDEHATIWTKPDEWLFDPKEAGRGVGRFFDDGFNAAFFDGSVHWISARSKHLGALFTRAGGEPVRPEQ